MKNDWPGWFRMAIVCSVVYQAKSPHQWEDTLIAALWIAIAVVFMAMDVIGNHRRRNGKETT